ncbi:hypothetical protein HPC37_10705, partial [Pasteurellaceae bacterium 20609_3]|uniref:hypothetical protein n=1 Tax=Spirabiliibacterium mucosae TaxID=28156 RepID=UPI001AACE318
KDPQDPPPAPEPQPKTPNEVGVDINKIGQDIQGPVDRNDYARITQQQLKRVDSNGDGKIDDNDQYFPFVVAGSTTKVNQGGEVNVSVVKAGSTEVLFEGKAMVDARGNWSVDVPHDSKWLSSVKSGDMFDVKATVEQDGKSAEDIDRTAPAQLDENNPNIIDLNRLGTSLDANGGPDALGDASGGSISDRKYQEYSPDGTKSTSLDDIILIADTLDTGDTDGPITISTGDGNDVIKANRIETGEGDKAIHIDMGNGDDYLNLYSHEHGRIGTDVTINMGDGDDRIYVEHDGIAGTTIDMGTGNDLIQTTVLGGNNNFNMGDGNDIIVITGNEQGIGVKSTPNNFDFGEGQDLLLINAVNTSGEFVNYTGEMFTNLEFIDLEGTGNQINLYQFNDRGATLQIYGKADGNNITGLSKDPGAAVND